MRGLSRVEIFDKDDEGEDYIEETSSDTSESDGRSPLRSVASIDSIQENADFVNIEQ